MTKISRLLRQDAGNISVEAAFLLPIFLALILGILYFGLTFYSQNAISHAVREGARYAIVRGSTSESPATTTDIANVTTGRVSALLGGQVDVSVVFEPSNMPGSDVTVTATYSLGPSAALLGVEGFRLTAAAKMTILQ